ncbi:hypothetical protein [Longimicrobium sp.]|uniref:hypothetical protein n=1 Tax=Longimicrobium sp. TaxID=2029185 RepID=UPI002CDDC5D1|nr:hypothetical protein [Longimicrobium sp.]HSU14730.1 hypothetical protein [Longimicrobium sp.]
MPDERKYRDEEIAEIFEAAAAARRGGGALSPAEGMTLAELQAIGGEVGLAPERIAEAAAALDLRREAARRSDFGMPVSVRRTVDLPRAPTDREWEMLVADLRETFNARGRVGSAGGIREWNHGNLHAYVEPTATGYRLRLGTTKGNALALNRLGAVSLVAALAVFVLLVLSGQLPDEFMIPLIFAAMGSAALAFNALRLPAWALEREEQMELVAARARVLLGAEPEPAAVAIGGAPVGEGS